MKAIPQDQLKAILTPIGEKRRVEASMEDRCNVEYSISQIEEGYESRSMAAYVDEFENPKSCLVVRVGRNWVSPALVCGVLLFWVDPSLRGTLTSAKLVKDMFATGEAFALLNECEGIVNSSWVYLGSEDMDSLLSHAGYDLQEKVFYKPL